LPCAGRAEVRDSDCTYAAAWRMLRSVNGLRNDGMSVPGIPDVMMSTIDASVVAWRSRPWRFGPVPPSPSLPWHHAHCESKICRPAAASLDGAGAARRGGAARVCAAASCTPAAIVNTMKTAIGRRTTASCMRDRVAGL